MRSLARHSRSLSKTICHAHTYPFPFLSLHAFSDGFGHHRLFQPFGQVRQRALLGIEIRIEQPFLPQYWQWIEQDG